MTRPATRRAGSRPALHRLAAGAVVVAATIAVSAAAVIALDTATPDASPAASARPGASRPIESDLAELPPASTYSGLSYDPKVSRSPTAQKSQSKLWYAEGRWWAVLHEMVTGELRIFGLDPQTQTWVDTRTLVDPRSFAEIDVLWDGEQLYVAAMGPRQTSPAHGARLYRFSLVAGQWSLDPDFPVHLTDVGAASIVIDKDSIGRLWVAYIGDSQLRVAASEGSDHVWGEPFTPQLEGVATAPDDLAALVAVRPGLIGLLWSNQRDGSVYFAAHPDGDPIDAWLSSEPIVSGLKQPDDHINLKADDEGRIVAAVKTSQDALPNPNPLAPQILLLVREADGVWHQYVVARVKDKHTRPIVLLNDVANEVFVVATSPFRGGAVYYKRSSMDRISFETGVGTALVVSPDDPTISNPTSTKQNVTPESGLLVLASDNSTGRYLHAVLDLASTPPDASPAGSHSPSPSPSPSELLGPTAAERVTLVRDEFEAWKSGSRLPATWTLRNPGGGLARIIGEPGKRVVRLRPPGTGAIRACRSWQPIGTGIAEVSFDTRTAGSDSGEALLALIRGPDGTVAQLRYGRLGKLAYFVGDRRTDTSADWRAGAWIRSTITIDLAAGTYSWRVVDAAGRPVLDLADLPAGATTSVAEVCFQAAAGNGRLEVAFDNLLVVRQ